MLWYFLVKAQKQVPIYAYFLVKAQKQLPICAREEVKSMSILQLPGLAGYQAFAVLHKWLQISETSHDWVPKDKRLAAA